VNQDMKENMAA